MKKIEFKNLAVVFLFLTALTACNKQDTTSALSQVPQSSPPIAKMAADSKQERISNGAELSLTEISEPANNFAKKYVALRHYLQIETTSQKMQASFDAAVQHCEALNCQLLSANFNRETPYSPPSANLSFRVPPRNIALTARTIGYSYFKLYSVSEVNSSIYLRIYKTAAFKIVSRV